LRVTSNTPRTIFFKALINQFISARGSIRCTHVSEDDFVKDLNSLNMHDVALVCYIAHATGHIFKALSILRVHAVALASVTSNMPPLIGVPLRALGRAFYPKALGNF